MRETRSTGSGLFTGIVSAVTYPIVNTGQINTYDDRHAIDSGTALAKLEVNTEMSQE